MEEERKKPYQVLLVQDNTEYTEFLCEHFRKEKLPFEVRGAQSLEQALASIEEREVDVILLELLLPDSFGIHAFEQIHKLAPQTPIVVLSTFDQEMLALEALRAGAQDYILKGEVEGKILPRVLQNAIERHRMRVELQNQMLTDDLTGLFNRRGFLILAEQQLKLAKRNDRELLFLLGDIDDFKQINDTHGHLQGDAALGYVARALNESFRESDILARFGGDEFAIAAIDANAENAELLVSRIEKKLKESYDSGKHTYEISLSLGVASFNSKKTAFVEQLIEEADQKLYEKKKQKKSVRS